MQDINQGKFETLLKKWLEDELSKDELVVFYRYLKQDDNRQLFEKTVEQYHQETSVDLSEERDWERIYASVYRAVQQPKIFLWKRYFWAAAAAVLFVAFGGLFFLSDVRIMPEVPRHAVTAPTDSKFVIQDSRGGKIPWDDFSKKKAYHDLTMVGDELHVSAASDELTYYTIDNPKGSAPISMRLSDGSNVVLNAGSSIYFPNRFEADKRAVTMHGEVIFKVAHRDNQLFTVHTDQLDIHVLGTTFNVKSFIDENIMETTLFEGSVKVDDPQGGSLMLTPGQQAVYNAETKELSKQAVQAENILAWKDGNLILDDESLRAVLSKIERIYDITCVYNEDYQDVKIWAAISTKEKLEDILPLLEKVGDVKLKLVDRTLFINQK